MDPRFRCHARTQFCERGIWLFRHQLADQCGVRCENPFGPTSKRQRCDASAFAKRAPPLFDCGKTDRKARSNFGLGQVRFARGGNDTFT